MAITDFSFLDIQDWSAKSFKRLSDVSLLMGYLHSEVGKCSF